VPTKRSPDELSARVLDFRKLSHSYKIDFDINPFHETDINADFIFYSSWEHNEKARIILFCDSPHLSTN